EDGNDVTAIEEAIQEAQKVADKPSLISVKTIIGFGMPKQGTSKAHSDAPGEEAVRETKRNLNWDENAQFFVPDEVYAHFGKAAENGARAEDEWLALTEKYEQTHGDLGKDFAEIRKNELPAGWEDALPKFDEIKPAATRAFSGEIINALAPVMPQLIGGSADLAPSNNTSIKESHDFQFGKYDGRVLHFGVREHAMGAAMNGMALYGNVIPFGGTFMTFSDYMRGSIRLAALSEVQVIYVFTHDSIGLGEDGPTHQSVEHIAALRAIPNLAVIRPADAHETREAWRIALKRQKAPTAFALSRQKVATIDRAKFATAAGLEKGAYILAEAAAGFPQLILIATGSEVGLALEARELLEAEGTPTRVVSMPCWEFFEEQSEAYRDEVLPPQITARLAIEAGVRMGWDRWIGSKGDTITQDRFGLSAPAEDVFREFGFTVENVVEKARKLL
ncbi:MAG TPA: transketolase, partial [Pyrinomonadaceae bacterium]|nr:transketolase [Pyrinomonadaceae bacterium]